MTSHPELLSFITEARKKGYFDAQIKNALIKNNWPSHAVEIAFNFLQPKYKIKNQVCVFLSDEILKVLEKRSKKNMFTIHEQIEDILRRSCIRKNSSVSQEKIDDFLVSVFSRSNKGRKRNK